MDLSKINPGIWLIAMSIFLFATILPGGVATLNRFMGGKRRIDTSGWTRVTTLVFTCLAVLLLGSGLIVLLSNANPVIGNNPTITPAGGQFEHLTGPEATITPNIVPISNATPTVSASNCDNNIRSVIDNANTAQLGVIKHILPAENLSPAWGEMAFRASYKVDRLLADKRLISMVDARYVYTSYTCHITQDSPKQAIVETNETWEYDAMLTCPDSPTPRLSTRIDSYHEHYVLIQKGGNWQIHDWTMDRQEKTEPWCE